MLIKIILYIFFSVTLMGSGEFKEIVPLENQNLFIEEKLSSEILPQPKKNNKIEKKKEKREIVVENKLEETISEVIVDDNIEVQEVVKNNSTPIITEEQLKNIIAQSKNSPLPESTIDMERKDFYPILKKDDNKSQFFKDIEATLDKYSFSDKSEETLGGKVTTKELTSDRLVDNLEFGVGVAYQNTEMYEATYKNQNSDIWTHTPVYATGKYKISEGDENNKYIKVNLGYAIGEYENSKEYNEVKNQSGVYYGIGGEIEYDSVTLDLMYQVNKDAYERDNKSQDDSRITFSVDYKFFN